MVLEAKYYLLLVAGLLALGLFAYVVGRSIGGRGPAPAGSRAERDQSDRWAGVGDVAHLVVDEPEADRVVIGQLQGRFVAMAPLQSVMITAPTGMGKTASVVVPTVLRWQGAAVVTSVKGDALALTIDHRRSQGPVWVFDPTGSSGQATCRWSPIGAATTYGGALRAASWLVSSSKVEKRGGDDRELWDTLGKQLIAPALFAANRTGQSMSQMARWLLFQEENLVESLLDEIGDADALAHWASIGKATERTKQSIYATAQSILDKFTHPDIQHALTVDWIGDDVFDPERLLSEGGTLYVVAPASDQEDFTPVFETLVNAVVRAAEQRSAALGGLPISPRLLLMLDEAANCAPLRRLPAIATAGRGQGLQLVTVWQDESQVETIYGATASRTLKANHTGRLFLPGVTDEKTLESVATLIGPHQVMRESTNRSGDGSVSTSRHLVSEALATPDYVRELPRDELLAVVSREKPMRLSTTPWYRDDVLRSRIAPEAAARFDAEFAPAPSSSRRRKARA